MKKFVFVTLLSLTAFFGLYADSQEVPLVYHEVQEIREGGKYLLLKGGCSLELSWLYRKTTNNWHPDDELKIYFYDSQVFEVENITNNEIVFAYHTPDSFKSAATIYSITRDGGEIQLSDGKVFSIDTPSKVRNGGFSLEDGIFWYHKKGAVAAPYVIRNVTRGTNTYGFNYLGESTKLFYGVTGFNIHAIPGLEDRMSQYVFGQEEAIAALSDTFHRFIVGLTSSNQPVGKFLFLGPPGVGKSFLAYALSAELLGAGKELLVLDLSRYSNSNDIYSLIGSPDQKQKGVLREYLKLNPESIILLQNVDKAHQGVQRLLNTVFKEGYFIDGFQQKVDVTKSIFILTSSCCGDLIVKQENKFSDEILRAIEPSLHEKILPELCEEVEPVLFRSLSPEAFRKVVQQIVGFESSEIKRTKGVELIFDDSVIEYLSSHGYSEKRGVHALFQLIDKHVLGTLAKALVNRSVKEGDTALISYDSGKWSIISAA